MTSAFTITFGCVTEEDDSISVCNMYNYCDIEMNYYQE